jgi:starch phosphorylase
MDRALAQGVDVWLNTPRRPLEACGVGGMKAGMNGVLNFSTLDGWWDEACLDADPTAPPVGFSIGTAGPYADEETQDELDANSLYETLEDEIVARFYDRDEHGVPKAWMASVKQSMATLAPTWDSLRMTREYTERFYLPGLVRSRQLRSGGAVLARAHAREIERLRINWPSLWITINVSSELSERRVEVSVGLGGLDPADLRVQLWIDEEGEPPRILDTKLLEHSGSAARYGATLAPSGEPSEEVVARIVPSPRHTAGEAIPGLITWSR